MKSTDKYLKKDAFRSDYPEWDGDRGKNRDRFGKRVAKRYKVYDDLIEEFDDGEHLGQTRGAKGWELDTFSERSAQFRSQAERKEASF